MTEQKLHWKQIEIMAYMKKNPVSSVSTISKNLDVTYSHVHKFLTEIIGYSWATTTKVGRVNDITLTTKGQKVGEACENLITEINTRP